jgi:tRNA-modifying protein YgfZ
MQTINDRQLTHNYPLQDEFNYILNKNYLFALPYLGSISIHGEKSAEFLQGQISCDVREINSQNMRPGALCNLQGRILALPHVINWSNLQLILPQDQLEITKASLAKTAMLSRVKLDMHLPYIYGFYLQNINDLIPFNTQLPNNIFETTHTDEFYCYKISEKCYIFITQNPITTFPELQQRGSLAWHKLQLQAQHVNIYSNSRGLFLPHRIGLHTLGYIHFNKGCYKGQEIIARTHYRAKLKHNLKLFTVITPEQLYSGQQIFDAITNSEIGELIDYCPLGNNEYLIAISSLLDHNLDVKFANHQASNGNRLICISNNGLS